jgi:hypothetical protein
MWPKEDVRQRFVYRSSSTARGRGTQVLSGLMDLPYAMGRQRYSDDADSSVGLILRFNLFNGRQREAPLLLPVVE